MLTLAYGALCRGLLAGSMTVGTKFSGDDLRRHDPKFQAPRFGQYLQAVKQLDRFAADNYGKRVVHLALRWILDKQGEGFALWGARKPDQLDPLDGVYGWKLDAAAMTEIDKILATNIKQPVGPEFMAPPERVCGLEEALRIDIHFKPHVAARFWRSGKPVAQEGGEIEAARRFDQQAETVAAAHHSDRRFRRAEHAHGFVLRRSSRRARAHSFPRRGARSP